MSGKLQHSVTFALVFMLLLAGCTYPTPEIIIETKEVEKEVKVIVTAAPEPAAHAKYIFLFIGDGMSIAQRNAAELFVAATTNANARPEETKLLMNSFPSQGMNTTYDLTSIIPDSAATGTALATGYKTASGVVSMDVMGRTSYTTIAEIAKDHGWKVGIVTTVSIDHATPAVFYAHESNRGNYRSIDESLVNSNFNYFAGGPMKEADGTGRADLWKTAVEQGWNLVRDRTAFDALQAGDDKVLVQMGYQTGGDAMYYSIDDIEENDILLPDLVAKGIELLANDKGFFMMVEGGKIDWACHANDAATAIHDTIALDNAVAQAYQFYLEHPEETLIIVTGDHETGGMTLGYAATGYTSNIGLLAAQKTSYDLFNAQVAEWREAGNVQFEDTFETIETMFGLKVLDGLDLAKLEMKANLGNAEAKASLALVLSHDELDHLKKGFEQSMLRPAQRRSNAQAYLLYGGYDPLVVTLTKILAHKAGISWTTYSHTAMPMQTSAIGVRAELFDGYYDQTDINHNMMDIAGFEYP